MEYCKCKNLDVDISECEEGSYCLKCLKEIEMPEPDWDMEYEKRAEWENEERRENE